MRACAHAMGSVLTTQVRSLITAARTQTLDHPSRPPVKRDWSAYDAAKTHELPDVLHLIGRFVDTASPFLAEPPRPGRPRTPLNDVCKALLAQSYLRTSNRVAQGQCTALGATIGLTKTLGHKTIERAYGDARVLAVLREVFRLTNVPVQGLEKVFSVDGSGMPTSVTDHYASSRSRQKTADRQEGEWPASHSARVYNVAVIGVQHKLLAAWRATTDPHARELAQFPHVFQEAKENHPAMTQLLGDGLYAGRPQVQLVADGGVQPRFLPRRNITLKRMGCDAWVTMLVAMAREPQQWFSQYHMRSISETGFSVINDGARIRKRLPVRQETESFLKAVVYNLRRLAQLRYHLGIEPLPTPPRP
jgi:transposase